MLVNFFFHLRNHGVPASIKEYLNLIEALKSGLVSSNLDDFYVIARLTLVKNESHFDRYDKAFSSYFEEIKKIPDDFFSNIPRDWLNKIKELSLPEEKKSKIKPLGDWEKIMRELQKRMEEQKKRHQGGSKWIGTAGTSPFGAYGYNPRGIRIGQSNSRNRSAVKVWDKREFRNLDDSLEIGTRNIKIALRRLRFYARKGIPDELDLDGTIGATAKNAGFLDLKMVPERKNNVKVLIFFDVGGSMEDYVKTCEELFSATKNEFKHLEYYYFHNFIYESVWKNNERRFEERIPLFRILNKYSKDYKLIFVGDATMSPYEIVYPGGSVEHHNEESGAVWIQKLLDSYPKSAWINPTPKERWNFYESISITKKIMSDRMYPLTINGIEKSMKELSK